METRFFVDSEGNYLGGFSGSEPPKDSREVPVPPVTGRDKWNFDSKSWIPYDPPVEEKRGKAYNEELGGLPNQIDAVYKGLTVLIPAFVKAGLLTPDEVAYFTPDKEAPPDSPAGWLGKIADIKERFPKEGG